MSDTKHAGRAMDQLEIAITRIAHQFAERIITKGAVEEVLLAQLRDLAAVQSALIQLDGMLGKDRIEPLFALVQHAATRSAEAHLVRAKENVSARLAIEDRESQNGAPRFT